MTIIYIASSDLLHLILPSLYLQGTAAPLWLGDLCQAFFKQLSIHTSIKFCLGGGGGGVVLLTYDQCVWTALCIIFSYLATKISAPNTLFAVIECAKYSQVGGVSSNIKASVVKWVNHNSDIESIWGTLVNTIAMIVQYALILMILFFFFKQNL